MTHGATISAAPGRAGRPDWLDEEPTVVRARVLRADDTPTLLVGVELPSVEDLATRSEADVDSAEPRSGDGGASITWALGYRKGYDAGHAEGFDAGRQAGRTAGYEDAARTSAARTARALDELTRDAARHVDELDRLRDTIAAQATELAFALAESIVGRELAAATDPGADAIRRALQAAPGDTSAVARLHPDDLALLTVEPAELAADRVLRVVADPAVERGGCVLRSGATSVDAGIGASVDRVRAALGLTAPDTPTVDQ